MGIALLEEILAPVKNSAESCAMDLKTVFTKTAKGVTQVNQKTQSLSRDLMKVLKVIDGKSTVEELADKARGVAPRERVEDVIAVGDDGEEVTLLADLLRANAAGPGLDRGAGGVRR